MVNDIQRDPQYQWACESEGESGIATREKGALIFGGAYLTTHTSPSYEEVDTVNRCNTHSAGNLHTTVRFQPLGRER